MVQEKIDFEKMWQDAKGQLSKISKETMELLKKGEEEVVKASGKAKVNFEIMVLKAKREQLFYLLGKESFKSLKKGKVASAKLENLIKQMKFIEKQISDNKKRLHKVN